METREVKLGDIVKYNKGYAFKSSEYTDEGVMVVRVTDFTLDSISDVDAVYLAPDDRYDKFILKTNDILIQTVGSWENNPNSIVGKVVRVPNQCDSAYLNQNIVRIIPNNDFNNTYLFYALKANQFSTYCVLRGQGAANQASITLDTIFRFKFKAHNFAEQKRIADILSAYDNLIENNNKRIKLLEQMAENLYKEWFVRFRFPGYEHVEFIDGFPKEWKICRIDQLSKIKAGGDAPDDSTKEITDECSIPIYSNGIENEGLYGYTSKAKISKPSITISARGTVGYTCLRRVSYTPIVRLICVIPHEEKLVNWLFYYFKRTIVIANGTSQQQITIPMMSREKVLLPTNNLIQNFYEYSTCYLDEIDSLKAQNSNLEKQRDMLLPRLMSGKIEV